MCQVINPIEQHRKVCGYAPAFVPRKIQHDVKSFGGKALLYPALQTPGEIATPYPLNQPVDKNALFLAQQLARFAGNCQTEKARNERINQANYLLTAAYAGSSDAEQFWGQF